MDSFNPAEYLTLSRGYGIENYCGLFEIDIEYLPLEDVAIFQTLYG